MTAMNAASLSASLLRAAGSLVAGINEGVTARGFGDTRPAYGFAFTLLSYREATVAELAEHLGVTPQAASQLVDELERKGYARRVTHPHDARARLVVLTERGWACTRAADAAAADVMRQWAAVIGEERLHSLSDDLGRIATGGPIKPAW
jgi:DNA-binding MarR family transcriptional regulator